MGRGAARTEVVTRSVLQGRGAPARVRRVPRARWQAPASRRGEMDPQREARRWLARELHDGPVQTLTGLIVGLETLRRERAAGHDDQHVQHLVDAARGCMQEMRSLLSEIRSEQDSEGDIVAGVNDLVAQLRTRTGMRVVVAVPSSPIALGGHDSLELLRIVGEALANVWRHSDARSVSIELGVADDALTVTVSDDGRGFDATLTPAGMGRRGMFERAAVLGAALSVDSSDAGGTTVRVTMPLRDRS